MQRCVCVIYVQPANECKILVKAAIETVAQRGNVQFLRIELSSEKSTEIASEME